MGELFL